MTNGMDGLETKMIDDSGKDVETQLKQGLTSSTEINSQSNGIPENQEQPEQTIAQPEQNEQVQKPEQKSQAEINYEYQAKRFQSLADKIQNIEPEQFERLIQLDRQLKGGLAPELNEYLQTKKIKSQNTDEFGLEVPVKPNDYDPVIAITDPDSESGIYNQQLQDYRFDRRLAEREAKTAQEREKSEIENNHREMINSLRNTYKMPDEEIADLEEFIADPDTYTIPNMVKFYKVAKGSKTNPTEQKLNKEYDKIQRNMQIPQPVATMQGQSPNPKTDDELVGESLLRWGNRDLNYLK